MLTLSALRFAVVIAMAGHLALLPAFLGAPEVNPLNLYEAASILEFAEKGAEEDPQSKRGHQTVTSPALVFRVQVCRLLAAADAVTQFCGLYASPPKNKSPPISV